MTHIKKAVVRYKTGWRVIAGTSAGLRAVKNWSSVRCISITLGPPAGKKSQLGKIYCDEKAMGPARSHAIEVIEDCLGWRLDYCVVCEFHVRANRTVEGKLYVFFLMDDAQAQTFDGIWKTIILPRLRAGLRTIGFAPTCFVSKGASLRRVLTPADIGSIGLLGNISARASAVA